MSQIGYIESKNLCHQARDKGFRFLRFPAQLEESFTSFYRESSLTSLPRTVIFTAILYAIVYQLTNLHIPHAEFIEIINNTTKHTFDGTLNWRSFEGSLTLSTIVSALFIFMYFLPKFSRIRPYHQLNLTVMTSVILALILVSYALVKDERYQFIVEIDIILGYLFIYSLVKLQTIYAFASSLISTVLFILAIQMFAIDLPWAKLITIFITMNMFGLIYSYINEYRERDRFLHMTEITAEKLHLDEMNRLTEEENDLKARLSKFYSVMSGEKNTHKLGEKIIQHLVPETGCSVATLYHMPSDKLNVLSQYGVSSKQQTREQISLGETLVGQAALEKEIIAIEKAPEDFCIIQSGLGTLTAPSITIVPMLFDNEVVAVLELASLKPISPVNMNFLNQASRSIATAIKTVYSQSLQVQSA